MILEAKIQNWTETPECCPDSGQCIVSNDLRKESVTKTSQAEENNAWGHEEFNGSQN